MNASRYLDVHHPVARSRRSRLLFVLPLVLLVAACAGSSGPAMRVLFVGNSYTFSNDMPGMVHDLASSVSRDLQVGMRAPGGWWWSDHAASPETMDAIKTGDWDYVVLQEQSMALATRDVARRVSYPAAVVLSRAVVGSGGHVVLFLTWGHRNGSPEIGYSSYSPMQIGLADGYEAFSRDLRADVAPVGMAWWMTLAERPDIDLYQADGSHPTRQGSYLAAAVITASLLDVDANTLDSSLGLPDDVAAALRSFAARAVAGEVPWSP